VGSFIYLSITYLVAVISDSTLMDVITNALVITNTNMWLSYL